MCVFTLEDHHGAVEVVVFPETFARFRGACEAGALLLVRGKFERDEESSRLQATEVLPLSLLRERLSRGVRIRLKAETPRETIGRLWDVVAEYRGDRPLAIEVVVNGGAGQTAVLPDGRQSFDPRAAIGTVRRGRREHLRPGHGGDSLESEKRKVKSERLAERDEKTTKLRSVPACFSLFSFHFSLEHDSPMADLLEFEEPIGVLLRRSRHSRRRQPPRTAIGRLRVSRSASTQFGSNSTRTSRPGSG